MPGVLRGRIPMAPSVGSQRVWPAGPRSPGRTGCPGSAPGRVAKWSSTGPDRHGIVRPAAAGVVVDGIRGHPVAAVAVAGQ